MTVTDAAGRVLFRRVATAREIAEARTLAGEADESARVALEDLARRRALFAAAHAPAQFAAREPPPVIATAAGDAQLQGLNDFAFDEPAAVADVPRDDTKSHHFWIDSPAPEEPPLFDPHEMDALRLRRTGADRD